MGELEMFIKQKTGIGNDDSFSSFGDRKILKGEIVYEHQDVILKRTKYKYETEECNLINIQTRTKCFRGWNNKGLSNHSGKVVELTIFDPCGLTLNLNNWLQFIR
jgi:hypothetical protein